MAQSENSKQKQLPPSLNAPNAPQPTPPRHSTRQIHDPRPSTPQPKIPLTRNRKAAPIRLTMVSSGSFISPPTGLLTGDAEQRRLLHLHPHEPPARCRILRGLLQGQAAGR